MTYEYVDSTERVGDLILQVVADTSGIGDPRENDNLATFLFFNHRRYELGDRHKLDAGEEEAFEGGGLKGLLKHIERNEGKVLAYTLVGMYDHSGITIYPIGKASEEYPMDPGGWDSGCLGLAYVTEKSWREMQGDDADPNELEESEERVGFGRVTVQMPRVRKYMLGEIEEYDDWLRGNVWGYVITKPCPHPEEHYSPRDVSKTPDDNLIAACPHAEHVDSCWGFIGDSKYAREEGLSVAKHEASKEEPAHA